MKECLKRHHDFRLLDQVFTDFLSSNRHRDGIGRLSSCCLSKALLQAKNLSMTAVESLTGVQYGYTKAVTTTRFHSSCTMMGLHIRASPAGGSPDTYLTRVTIGIDTALRTCDDSLSDLNFQHYGYPGSTGPGPGPGRVSASV
ncbi:hypothetical protein WJX79_008246 [Trebouxia sp. C0005]